MKLFWRVHHKDCPEFNAENASSAVWGAEYEPCPCRGREDCPNCEGTGERRTVRDDGYSCCESPEALIEYFEGRGGAEDDTPVVAFSGTRVGTGMDNEPLVVPDGEHVEWTTWKNLIEKYK